MKNITKIVITGGPCAGKSTAMNWIQNAFTEKGYTVLFVPETATELITGGVAPWTCGTNLDYQICQVKLQMEKERIFEQAAATMPGEKILIVCDRGEMDNRVYMDDREFAEVLRVLHLSEVELRDNYDAVFHLVTAAKGVAEAYTTANNAARSETPEQAAALDDKLLAAWTGHPHLYVIDNTTDFETKMRRLIAEIGSFLGEAGPTLAVRKFLVEYPDLEWLEKHGAWSRVEIIQTYLKAGADERIHVRQRGGNGHYIYSKTVKRGVSGPHPLETEQRLSQGEYLDLLMDADTRYRQLRKTRLCIQQNKQYFHVDVYPFWTDQAIVKIKLQSEDEEIIFPEGIRVIREVTGDAAYKNSSLALNH